MRKHEGSEGDGKTRQRPPDHIGNARPSSNDGKAVVTMPRLKRAVVNNKNARAPSPLISVVVDPLASLATSSNNNVNDHRLDELDNDQQLAFDAGEEAAAAAMEA